MARHVYDSTEGGREMAGRLGGKGANLAEMTRMGLPVPPGFTTTTGTGPAPCARRLPPAGRRLLDLPACPYVAMAMDYRGWMPDRSAVRPG
ncbi:PEP/pyruvate-binding domain-containing protein [Streptomyces sp. NPDC019396]|uniref:PEP/pyruvate-binding domain-containing protein n=1 Tax=Streptomyces sp. NPDC019396 TaxID=3154687 RepID=UPI0033E55807